jgi:hypothetical protein
MAEAQPARIGLGTRIKAFICTICPLCCAARRWPASAYARRIRVIRDRCPFCRAYIKIKLVQRPAAPTQPSPAA